MQTNKDSAENNEKSSNKNEGLVIYDGEEVLHFTGVDEQEERVLM